MYRTGHIHSSNTWSSVKKLGKKARLGTLQEVARALIDRAQQVAAPLAAAPLAGTEAVIAALEPAVRKDAAARVTFTLKKCPSCDAHHVAITLHTHSVNKQPAAVLVATFDKTETGTGSCPPGP